MDAFTSRILSPSSGAEMRDRRAAFTSPDSLRLSTSNWESPHKTAEHDEGPYSSTLEHPFRLVVKTDGDAFWDKCGARQTAAAADKILQGAAA